jgi:hypothetical protein
MGSLFCHLPIRLTLWSFSSHYVPPRLAGPRQHGPPYAARLPFHQDAAPHENMDTARSHLHAASLLRRGKGRASPTRFLRSPGSSTATSPSRWPAATPLSIRGRPRLTPSSLAGSPLPPPPSPLPTPAVRRALGGLWGTFSAWRPLWSAPPTLPSRCTTGSARLRYTAAPFNAARSAPSPRLLPLTRFTYASGFFVGVLELRICGDHCYAVLDLVDTGSTSPIIGLGLD